jgi:hypothetical protein
MIKLAIGPRVKNGPMDDVTVTRLWKKRQVRVVPFQGDKRDFSLLNKVQIGSNLLFNEK